MGVESFGYTLSTAFLGAIIVFVSLIGLSMMMVLLNVILKEREAEGPKPPVIPPVSSHLPPPWLIPAVSVFLSMEIEDAEISPTLCWKPTDNERLDPWRGSIPLNPGCGAKPSLWDQRH